MKYTMTTPCSECPFLTSMRRNFTIRRLEEFASGNFPCHKTADNNDETSEFVAREDSQHCAGAFIYLEKRGRSHNMMRIAERLGLYDHTKLNMEAKVR